MPKTETRELPDWWLFTGQGGHRDLEWPVPPPWRRFAGATPDKTIELRLPAEIASRQSRKGQTYRADMQTIDAVNAALYLRRPLLVTGKPGVGKSSLAFAVAHELDLGAVCVWPVTSGTRIADGLYQYDAIARLQAAQIALTRAEYGEASIKNFLRLGPVGTAFLPSAKPRVLLIDEIDKGDIDLPNELLYLFEDGEFSIPELGRLSEPMADVRVWSSEESVPIVHGRVRCAEFPFVVMTSNGERDFPPAFLRRCLRLVIPESDAEGLQRIVEAHFGEDLAALDIAKDLIRDFVRRRDTISLATDQLLNAVHLVVQGGLGGADMAAITDQLWRSLDESGE